MSVSEWGRELGISYNTLKTRIRSGLGPTEIVSPHRFRRASKEHIPDGAPGAESWQFVAWQDDPHAQALVREWPDGLLHASIGVAFGVTRERARQLQVEALEKYRAAREILALLGPVAGQRRIEMLTGEDLATYREELREVRETVSPRRRVA